jgi:hypothetical protein
MYYDQLKPEIDAAYGTYTASLNPDETPKKRITFQAEFTKEKYANEEEEVLEKVKEYRKERQEKLEGGFKSMDAEDILA